jgi:hypothetical protein
MNNDQRWKLLQAIARGAQLDCDYMHRDGDTCIVGEMAKMARFRHATIMKMSGGINSTIAPDDEDYKLITKVREKLCEFFGITRRQLVKLQHINDANDKICARRKALAEEVKSWPVSNS